MSRNTSMDVDMHAGEMKKPTEVVASIEQAARLSLLTAFPVLCLYVAPYWLINHVNPFMEIDLAGSIWLLVLVIPGIVIHELIHGFFFAIFSKKGFRSIRFGIKWEYLTPYCHCKVPVRVWQYAFGALAPLLILGVGPALAGYLLSDFYWILFGVFFTWAAAGDVLSVWLLRRFPASWMVKDHESNLGFYVMRPDVN